MSEQKNKTKNSYLKKLNLFFCPWTPATQASAHGIHFTKKARFLSTSNKDYFVRDRYLLFARILLPLVIVNVLLSESYRMTRKYFVFVFSNFSSE